MATSELMYGASALPMMASAAWFSSMTTTTWSARGSPVADEVVADFVVVAGAVVVEPLDVDEPHPASARATPVAANSASRRLALAAPLSRDGR